MAVNGKKIIKYKIVNAIDEKGTFLYLMTLTNHSENKKTTIQDKK
jgi:hypothetical protein